uniref:Leucine rich repeat containing 24 n=1 Tax=Neovison vison TaxID=452646 RepID=A0A8C7C464_NEOVI
MATGVPEAVSLERHPAARRWCSPVDRVDSGEEHKPATCCRDSPTQLFLDDSKMKNFITCFKDPQFLVTFFSRLRPNRSGRYETSFPFLSPCGRERNFLRCEDRPVVFTHLLASGPGPPRLSYCGGGEALTVPFEPARLLPLAANGRLYHPAPERAGGVGLVRSALAFELSACFEYPWPRGRPYCCCYGCCGSLTSRPALPAARPPAAATAPRWSAAPCGCASFRPEFHPGRRWAPRGATGPRGRGARDTKGGCWSALGKRETPSAGSRLLLPPPSGPQTLFLQDNSIARLEPGVLAPLAALRRLYLHNNSLRALEPGAFRAQPRLLELALTGNRLRGLRVGAFAGLGQLRALYLAGNQLVQLLDFTFLHLPVRGSRGQGQGSSLHCPVRPE